MSFEQKIVPKRRAWKQWEKEEALKSCSGRCACCGARLTMDTLTMEHVVPISRGGENVMDNLVVLCSSCNRWKSDKFMWPWGTYGYLDAELCNDKKMHEISEYTLNWAKNNVTEEWVREYPLICDELNCKFTNYVGRFSVVTHLTYVEVKEDSVDRLLSDLKITKTDIMKRVYADGLFSLIGVYNKTKGKYIGAFTIQYYRGTNDDLQIIVGEVYTNTSSCRSVSVSRFTTLSNAWYNIGIQNIFFVLKEKLPISFWKDQVTFKYKCAVVDAYPEPTRKDSVINDRYTQMLWVGKEEDLTLLEDGTLMLKGNY